MQILYKKKVLEGVLVFFLGVPLEAGGGVQKNLHGFFPHTPLLEMRRKTSGNLGAACFACGGPVASMVAGMG